MPFDTTPLATDVADAILVWCGVTSPTPAEVVLAEMASDAAIGTIRHYRGLDNAKAWTLDTTYVLGDIRQPTHENQHLYQVTTAGTSDDETEPTWPTTDGGTVTDGTVVWTEYVRPFETKYNSLAIEMGVYLYQKRGVDGVNNFSENGLQRSYEKGSFPPSMLSRITPVAETG